MTAEELWRCAVTEEKAGNVLWGKKWVAVGDSFTQGVTGTLIPEGPYKGWQLNSSCIIAARNHMELTPFYRGGRCLAFPADGSFHNSLTDPEAECYYQNIPEDADYITIRVGINDSHHEHGKGGDGEDPKGVIPLGAPDDETTATYCGAWNVVLSWLIAHRPFAHLGILVTNGCDRPAYREVQRAMAKKYGLPFLDLNGDERCPAMIRSQNPEISDAVKRTILLKQAVDYPRNTHPNDAAHVFESTLIEAFLRTL